MTLNMGPQHPSTHGVLRVVLELDGETVMRARPILGYLHTGMEKQAESKTYTQSIPQTDRMDYTAPLSNNLAFCLAAEKLLGIEPPPRVQAIRVLLTELTLDAAEPRRTAAPAAALHTGAPGAAPVPAWRPARPRLRLIGAAVTNMSISDLTARLGGSPLFRDVNTQVVKDATLGSHHVRQFEVECTVLPQSGEPK